MIRSWLWFAVLHDLHHTILVLSYTGRAAINLENEFIRVYTTSTGLGIGYESKKKKKNAPSQEVQQRLEKIDYILNEEMSFTSLQHFERMSKHTVAALGARADQTKLFGGLSLIQVGDFAQHQPPNALPLFTGAAAEESGRIAPEFKNNASLATARVNFKSMDTVVVLCQQMRQNQSHGGKILTELAGRLRNGEHTEADLQLLNSRSIGSSPDACPAQYSHLNLRLPPSSLAELQGERYLVLRNSIKDLIIAQRLPIAAAAANQRLICWNAEHSAIAKSDGQSYALPEQLIPIIMKASEQHFASLPACGYFYSGLEYLFTKNEHLHLGWTHNNSCIAKKLILNTNEPPDPGDGPYWRLQKPPLAVVVSIVGHQPGRVCTDLDENCVPVCSTEAFLSSSATKFPLPSDCKFKIKRRNIPLVPALAFTDYWAQGQSLRPPPITLLDLLYPPDGHYRLESLYVAITRFTTIEDVVLLRPLWRNEQEKKRFLDKVLVLPSPDRLAEERRLGQLALETKHRFAQLWSQVTSLLQNHETNTIINNN